MLCDYKLYVEIVFILQPPYLRMHERIILIGNEYDAVLYIDRDSMSAELIQEVRTTFRIFHSCRTLGVAESITVPVYTSTS